MTMRAAVLTFIVLAAAMPLQAQKASVMGVVVDSLNSGGLTDATILIEGTTLSRMSNAAGEFRFDSVPPGKRRFVLQHPIADSIGVDIISAPITLTDGNVSL